MFFIQQRKFNSSQKAASATAAHMHQLQLQIRQQIRIGTSHAPACREIVQLYVLRNVIFETSRARTTYQQFPSE